MFRTRGEHGVGWASKKSGAPLPGVPMIGVYVLCWGLHGVLHTNGKCHMYRLDGP